MKRDFTSARCRSIKNKPKTRSEKTSWSVLPRSTANKTALDVIAKKMMNALARVFARNRSRQAPTVPSASIVPIRFVEREVTPRYRALSQMGG